MAESPPVPQSSRWASFWTSRSRRGRILIGVAVVFVLVMFVGALAVSFRDTSKHPTREPALLGRPSSSAKTANPSFAPDGAVPVGDFPAHVATADINDDGKADLAVANSASNDVTILLATGAGDFSAASGSPLRVGGEPSSIAAADVDGDGKADLAVANNTSDTVTVLLGDGDGSFSPAADSPLKVFGPPLGVTAADLNGDRRVDLAVPTYQKGVVVLLGTGAGRFAPAPGSPIAVNDPQPSVAVGDFNRDGNRDLTIASTQGTSIVLGDGTGRFGAAAAVQTARGPDQGVLGVADFNRDRKADLAVTNVASDLLTLHFRVLLGNGAGGFRPAPGPSIAVGPSQVGGAVADFNGDRKTDVAVTNLALNNVTVLLGNGAGGFRAATDSPFAALRGSSIAAADLNEDGKVDLAVAGGALTILLQTSSTPAVVHGRALPGRADAVFSTRGRITKLAVDGNRVAVVTTKIDGACGRVVVWTAPGRKSTSFKPAYLGCFGDGIGEVALGGGQVAWIERGGGNDLELSVMAAKLSGGAAKQIDYVTNGDRAGGNPSGDWVGRLVGGGAVLAYNSWRAVCDLPPDYGCVDYQPWEFHFADKKLVQVSAARRLVVKHGPDSYPLRAVGGGRIAVESAGAVNVLAPSGARVATVAAVDGNPPRAIALSRTRLAVLRTFTLDLYDPATGAEAKSLPLGPAAALQLAGVNAKLALLRGPHRLVLVRLSDGKLISFPLASGTTTRVVGTGLTGPGLIYALNTPRLSSKGRIVFEPTAKLLARF
jgi:FG-GAP-like repeat